MPNSKIAKRFGGIKKMYNAFVIRVLKTLQLQILMLIKKILFTECYVWSVLLFRQEGWSLKLTSL